jgi:hypothetical protein
MPGALNGLPGRGCVVDLGNINGHNGLPLFACCPVSLPAPLPLSKRDARERGIGEHSHDEPRRAKIASLRPVWRRRRPLDPQSSGDDKTIGSGARDAKAPTPGLLAPQGRSQRRVTSSEIGTTGATRHATITHLNPATDGQRLSLLASIVPALALVRLP